MFKTKLTESQETNFLYYLRKKIALGQGASLFNRKVLEQIRYPESVRNAEDISVFFQVLATQTCVSIEEPVVMHIKHKDSLRNQYDYHKAAGIVIADLIFDKKVLDLKYFKYRNEYISLRYLSLSRIAYRHKAFDAAIKYYESAIKTFPRHLFKFSYFKKYLNARLQKL